MEDYKKRWRKKNREYLAAAFGGKCTVCGYDKTIAALDYHHVDPDQKDDALSKAMKNGHAWSRIIIEARKCACVCCRCHREIHAGVTELPIDYIRFNEEYVNINKLKIEQFDICPICKQEKYKKFKFCSQVCSHKSQMKFHFSKEELEVLLNTSS